MTCSSCGRTFEGKLRFCGECGKRQSTQTLAARGSTGNLAIPTPDVSGRTLRELCLGSTLLDWRSAFEILVAMCHAVAGARAARALELSLDPESFYAEKRDGRWLVTLLDADLDPGRDEPHDTEVRPASPGWLVHRQLDYFSPEKIMGKPLDGASDVYSLGTIAFELVTGRLPFADARGPADLLTAMVKRSPPVPSTLVPQARIPPAVDAVLLACLAKDRHKRYPDARMLAHAAAHVLAVEPIVALPAVRRPLPPKPPRPVKPPEPTIRLFQGGACGNAACKALHQFMAPANRTLVGAWMYFDHFDSLDAKRPVYLPHPHVGIAALTYLFEGRLVHHDSAGNRELIKPNTLGWLHAGQGVVHSEHQHPIDRAREARLHGLELWVALPRPNEDDPPAFALHPPGVLPSVVISGARVRVVLGEGFGVRSPVETPAPLSMFDVRLPKGAAVPLPSPRHHNYQRGVYVVAGAVEIGGKVLEARQLAVIAPTASVGVTAVRDAPAHVVMLGSAPMLGPRHRWWMFVSSSPARIEEAKQRYLAGELGDVPGEPMQPQLPKL